MEYGLIPKIDQAADNHQIMIKQVQPSNQIAKLNEGKEAQNLIDDDFLKKVDDNKVINADIKVDSSPYEEVILTNLNFGFNDKSKDFYVKVTRGDVENQYPTDEMMKLKAYIISQNKEAASKAL